MRGNTERAPLLVSNREELPGSPSREWIMITAAVGCGAVVFRILALADPYQIESVRS